MSGLDYGVIGNCRTAALVSKEGSIDWLCFPDFDSPSVFSKILDEKIGGEFSFILDESYSSTQRYVRETNILCTTFDNGIDAFEVLDFMPRYKTGGDAQEYYLPAEICRYIRVLKGSPSVIINYNPSFNYAKEGALHYVNGKYIRSSSALNEQSSMFLYSNYDLNDILDRKSISLKKEGYILLSYNQKLIEIDLKRIYLEYSRTKVYWLNWVNRSKCFKEFDSVFDRSSLILKLMSYQPSGAVLAALTTSIPETIGEERNWDYRFCWIRDASMSIETLISIGHLGAAKRFISFIKCILKSKDDSFQIMYGIRGERELTESVLDHLSGYMDSKPVRIGNAAYSQKQNDSVGYLMDVIYKYFLYFPGTLNEVEDMWQVVKNIVRDVYLDWREPDKGIWEIRGNSTHFVFSKVMSWVALDRAIKIAELLDQDSFASMWREEANSIVMDVHIKGWNAQLGSFTQAYDNSALDSSLLLMEEYGFIEPDNPRFISTVKAIKNDLLNDDLMYRYRVKDDFGEPKSAFTICTFWMIRALYVIGEQQQARDLFSNLLKYSNHLGLFSEDLDFVSKRQLGNFPQAYSHLALINTIELFSKERERSCFIKP